MKLLIGLIALMGLVDGRATLLGENNAPKLKADTVSPRKLTLVATVDGKSFFTDQTKRNWWDSRTYCRSMGMKLASLTTAGQWSAVQTGMRVFGRSDSWTSGRESYQRSEYVWDGKQDQLPTSIPFHKYSNVNLDYHSCNQAVIDAASPGSDGLYYYTCSSKDWVLCET